MTENISLCSPGNPKLALHSIDVNVLENMRLWKNEHRDSFFYKNIISSEDQKKWYEGYLARDNDFMFVVTYADKAIGCIGFRYLCDRIDVYNVILGDKEATGKGYMSMALHLLVREAERRYPGAPITLKVLKSNPALHWYRKNGFVIAGEQDEYCEMRLSATIHS